jgi:prophage regulatory protein
MEADTKCDARSVHVGNQFDPATMIIRIGELSAITGYARATIYKRLKDDPSFPRPVPLSNSKAPGAPVGWILAEAQQWVRQRMAMRGEVAA